MGYGKIKEEWTPQGCRVVTIKTVSRKEFTDLDGISQGNLLTPTEHIFLSVPEKDE